MQVGRSILSYKSLQVTKPISLTEQRNKSTVFFFFLVFQEENRHIFSCDFGYICFLLSILPFLFFIRNIIDKFKIETTDECEIGETQMIS